MSIINMISKMFGFNVYLLLFGIWIMDLMMKPCFSLTSYNPESGFDDLGDLIDLKFPDEEDPGVVLRELSSQSGPFPGRLELSIWRDVAYATECSPESIDKLFKLYEGALPDNSFGAPRISRVTFKHFMDLLIKCKAIVKNHYNSIKSSFVYQKLSSLVSRNVINSVSAIDCFTRDLCAYDVGRVLDEQIALDLAKSVYDFDEKNREIKEINRPLLVQKIRENLTEPCKVLNAEFREARDLTALINEYDEGFIPRVSFERSFTGRRLTIKESPEKGGLTALEMEVAIVGAICEAYQSKPNRVYKSLIVHNGERYRSSRFRSQMQRFRGRV